MVEVVKYMMHAQITRFSRDTGHSETGFFRIRDRASMESLDTF